MSHTERPTAATNPPRRPGRSRTRVFGAKRRRKQNATVRIAITQSVRKNGRAATAPIPNAPSMRCRCPATAPTIGTDEAAAHRNGRMITTER